MMNLTLDEAPLGKKSAYVDKYDKSLLFPIARRAKREEIGIDANNLPFYGKDFWTAFEISWLNPKGKPQVAVADIIIDASSEHLIESKSLKLYLNSLNNSVFENKEKVCQTISQDLGEVIGAKSVMVNFVDETALSLFGITTLPGTLIDDIEVSCSVFEPSKDLIEVSRIKEVSEVLTSHLLKSNCLVTGQPDWGSLQISYSGPKIDRASLLKYIVSFRNHNEFHEQCVERIFKDLSDCANFSELTVYARYTRRGGLDINPIRSTKPISNAIKNIRLFRQ